MSRLTAALRALHGPAARARVRAYRDGQAVVRLSIGRAALRSGVLAALAGGPRTTDEVATATGTTDSALLPPWLRVLEAIGYLRVEGGTWSLTSSGRLLLTDPALRAEHEAFTGYHQDLYRGLPDLLTGGPARRDVAEHADVIARLSQVQEPLVSDLLAGLARRQRPARVLDIGCGAGANLVALLRSAPAAVGVGIDVDAAVAAAARASLEDAGVADRAQVLAGEFAALVSSGDLTGPFDLAVFANAVYYLPLAERVPALAAIGGLLAEGGVLVVVTTAAEADVSSRHFDLLLRAQRQGMELPDVDDLVEQLRQAGLSAEGARRLVPGTPLVAVLARREAGVSPRTAAAASR